MPLNFKLSVIGRSFKFKVRIRDVNVRIKKTTYVFYHFGRKCSFQSYLFGLNKTAWEKHHQASSQQRGFREGITDLSKFYRLDTIHKHMDHLGLQKKFHFGKF